MRAIDCIPEFLHGQFDLKAIHILEHLDIQGISIDTRTLQRGELFVALDGTQYRATFFIKEAIQKGAAAIFLQKREI